MTKQVKIILFSCLYITGIIGYFSNKMLIAGALVLVCLFGLFHKFKDSVFKEFSLNYFLFLIIIFCLGLINTALHLNYDDDLTPYTDKNVTLTAKVLTIPTNNEEFKTKFYAQVSSVKTENTEAAAVNAKTLVTVAGKQKNSSDIQIGDTLELTGRLKEPSEAKNPSQFDYAKYLQFKNTFSLLYVKDDWEILSGAGSFKWKFIRKLNNVRNDILKIHSNNIKSPMIEVLGGIIFGDDAVNPDNNTKISFINSGIIHILAASGMNVTLIIGIWFFIARFLKFNYKLSIITGIMLILFYTCMTGFGPPIIRASLMLTLVLLGKLIDKSAPTLGLLFLVAVIMLIYNPLMIFDIGFQLSFIVTFALILTSPLLKFNFKFKPVNFIAGMCIIPIIAQIYAAPLQMYYFNTFALYSVFANITVIPVLSIVSFLGFISSMIALVPIIADKVCLTADFILNPFLIYIVKTAEFFSKLPHSIIYLKKPSELQIFLYYTLIIVFTCIIRNCLQKENQNRAAYFNKKLKPVFCLILIFFALTFIEIPDKKADIIFFSVGNADCALIKSPDNKYFIIDTGKMAYLSENSQAKFIILKYLKDRGIKNIHSLILSHFDADHAGGTVDILENVKVQNLYITDTYENTNLFNKISNYLTQNNMKPIIVDNEREVYSNKGFKISVIKPQGGELKSENEKSLVTKVSIQDKNIVFMGDGDVKTYNVLPQEYKKNISVIKSGHHGAKNTINKEMIDNTDLFIISTGPNVYNHPHKTITDLLNNAQKQYLRTDYHNAIKIETNKNLIQAYCYSPAEHKFVKKH